MKKASKMTFLALSITLALILSFVESQIPAFVAIPGVKVGLPNIVIVFLLYKVGAKEAGIVSALRVVMVGFLFGSMMSMLYSLAGAILSFCGMALLKKTNWFSTMAVSVTGGLLHNVGQIGVACLVTETTQLLYYLPVLMISGVIAGVVIGVAGALMVKRVPTNFM